MAQLNHTKPFPTLNNIHVADEATIIEFLNTNSKAIGALKYLGSFVDNLKIKNEIGIKAKAMIYLFTPS